MAEFGTPDLPMLEADTAGTINTIRLPSPRSHVLLREEVDLGSLRSWGDSQSGRGRRRSGGLCNTDGGWIRGLHIGTKKVDNCILHRPDNGTNNLDNNVKALHYRTKCAQCQLQAHLGSNNLEKGSVATWHKFQATCRHELTR